MWRVSLLGLVAHNVRKGVLGDLWESEFSLPDRSRKALRKSWTVTFSASIWIFIRRPLVTCTCWLGARYCVAMLPTLGSVNRVRVQLAS